MRLTCPTVCLVVILSPTLGLGQTLNCALKDGATVSSLGKLARDVGVDWFQENYREFSFDVDTGAFRASGETVLWSIARQGSSANDLIAYLDGDDPFFNVMRISTWETPMRVSITDGMDLYGGTCTAN